MGSAQKSPGDAPTYSRRAERHRHQQAKARRGLILRIAAVGVVVAAVVVLIVALAGGGDDSSSTPAYAGSTVTLSLSDYAITGNLTVPAGPARIVATNVGGLPHNIGVRGVKISRNLNRGESTTLDLGVLAPGTYELYCDVIGADKVSHVAKGMVAKLIVTPADATTSTTLK